MFLGRIRAILLFFAFILLASARGQDTTWEPSTSAEDDAKLEAFVTKTCPDIATVYYLETADGVQRTKAGNRLQVITLGRHPRRHQIGVPEVRLTGNIHGNEVASRIVLQHFIKLVCLMWSKKKTSVHGFERFFRYLPKNRIHILMSANPDGYDAFVSAYRQNSSDAEKLYLWGRNNANNRDLNRNFFVDPILLRADQDYDMRYPTEKMFHPPANPGWKQEIETQMIQRWMENVDFLLGASFHGGQRLATVPFDAPHMVDSDGTASPSSQYHLSVEVAKVYMEKFQHFGCGYKNDPKLDAGVSNGAAWYPFIGSMGDYSFLMTNCLDVTIEMFCAKYPRPNFYKRFKNAVLWQINAMMDFMITAQWGIKGVVTSQDGNPVPNALIFTMEMNGHARFAQKPTVASIEGEYFRLLPDGRHVVLVAKRGFSHRLVCIEVRNQQLTSPETLEAQVINFKMQETFVPSAQLLDGCLANEMYRILSAYSHWSGFQFPYFD